MADTDEHRSVLAYIVGAALGGIALAVTAWVGLRGRRRRDPGAVDAEGSPVPVDEDLV